MNMHKNTRLTPHHRQAIWLVLPARLHLQAEHHFVRRVAPLDEECHLAAVKCIPGGVRPFLDGFVEVHHAIARDHLLDIGLQRVGFPIGLGARVRGHGCSRS